MKLPLNCEFDARVWVDEWLETLKMHPNAPWDRGFMIGWFANAIMAGFDEANRQHQKGVEESHKAPIPTLSQSE